MIYTSPHTVEGRVPRRANDRARTQLLISNNFPRKGNDLNEEDINGLTILMHTMFINSQGQARKLLRRGADINYVNSNTMTALMYCVKQKKIEAVKFLLEKGAHKHIMNHEGKDACDIAVENELALEIE